MVEVAGGAAQEHQAVDAARRRLLESGLPVVETWDLSPKPLDMLVGFSNEDAAAAAALHLAKRGYDVFGFIGGMDQRSSARLAGFCAGVKQAGLPVPTALRISTPSPSSVIAGGTALLRLMEQQPRIRAVFCTNDLIAAGALFERQRQGWKVPQNLAVMGFSNLAISQVTVPTLTTVQVGAREIGLHAATMLLDKIESLSATGTKIDVGFSIIERESA
jgi:LacI family gluconate utilization system Gnt-I transcriptional repressor